MPIGRLPMKFAKSGGFKLKSTAPSMKLGSKANKKLRFGVK
jgi:hypothetical protein